MDLHSYSTLTDTLRSIQITALRANAETLGTEDPIEKANNAVQAAASTIDALVGEVVIHRQTVYKDVRALDIDGTRRLAETIRRSAKAPSTIEAAARLIDLIDQLTALHTLLGNVLTSRDDLALQLTLSKAKHTKLARELAEYKAREKRQAFLMNITKGEAA